MSGSSKEVNGYNNRYVQRINKDYNNGGILYNNSLYAHNQRNISVCSPDKYVPYPPRNISVQLTQHTQQIYDDNKIDILIAGVKSVALLDTGSTLSAISRQLYNKLSHYVTVSKCINQSRQCVLADGSEIFLNECVNVPIKLNNVSVEAKMYILDIGHISVLIGCDLLKKMQATIDYRNSLMITYGNESSFNNLSNIGVLQQVTKYDDHNRYSRNEKDKENTLNDIDLNGINIDDRQRSALMDLLNAYKDIFAQDITQIGKTPIITYDIEVEQDLQPFRLAQYKCPYQHRQVIEDHVKKLLKADLIAPAQDHRWGNPLVLVTKQNSKEMRVCQDMRKLNSYTILKPYPMLDLDCLLCDIGKRRCTWFSVIDLRSAYTQVEMTERSQKMCTFTCHLGDFVPKRCVFGLKNMSSLFQRLMDIIFQDVKNKFVAYFQDDIICFSETYDEHLMHLREIFSRLRKANLKAQPTKTSLCREKVTFLGFQISLHGIETDNKNIEKVKKISVPKTRKQLRGFLGLVNFYRKFTQNYAAICAPLYKLTEKDSTFVWNEQCQNAFDKLKNNLIHAPILALPQFNTEEDFILTTDVSGCAIGFIMSQYQKDLKTNKMIERVIYYGSKNLKPSERKYGSTHLEILGAAYAVQKLDVYLRGRHFKLVTDHKSILYLMKKKVDEMKPIIARRVIFLSQYDIEYIHRPGSLIQNVDYMSRKRDSTDENDSDNEVIFAIQNRLAREDNLIDIEGISFENIRQGQRSDYFFRAMYTFIKLDQLPTDHNMVKKVKAQYNDFHIHDKLLYHIWKNNKSGETYNQLCMPVEFRSKVMACLHDLKTSGHVGYFKMYLNIARRYYWKNMSSDIQNYVSSCKLCCVHNTGHDPKIKLHSIQVPLHPFSIIHADTLYISTKSNSFQYILVLICAFSKLVVTVPLRNRTAPVIAKAIYFNLFLRYGFVKHITSVTDNGLEMVNKWTYSLYEIMGVKALTTIPWKPSTDGQVERSNRIILSMLRKFTQDDPKQWSQNLPLVTAAINASVSESTGYQPYHLLHGIENANILDLQLPQPPENIPKNELQAKTYWYKSLEKIRAYAKENIALAKQKQKKQYDVHARDHGFKIGDLCFIKIHHWHPDADSKLKPRYKGVYKIKSFLSDTNAILEDEKGNTLPRSVYINYLKKYEQRKDLSKPRQKRRNIQTAHNISEVSTTDTEDTSHKSSNGIDSTLDEDNLQTEDELSFNEEESTDIENKSGDDTVEYIPKQTKKQQKTVTPISEDVSQSQPQSQDESEKIQQHIPNSPTEEFFRSEEEENYEVVKKVFKQKYNKQGIRQVYVSWKNFPGKKHRQWINFDKLSPALQDKVNKWKLPEKHALQYIP